MPGEGGFKLDGNCSNLKMPLTSLLPLTSRGGDFDDYDADRMDEDMQDQDEAMANGAEGEGEGDVNGAGPSSGKKPSFKPAAAKPTMGAGREKFDKPNEVRVTTPYMTKYERARILGTRALQIRFASDFLLYSDHYTYNLSSSFLRVIA